MSESGKSHDMWVLAAYYFVAGCFVISMFERDFGTVLSLSSVLIVVGSVLWGLTSVFIPNQKLEGSYSHRKHYLVCWLLALLIMLKSRFGLFG